VKRALIAATTKTQKGGRKETAHINDSTSRLKIGRALVFIPPGVVTIFIVGLVMMLSTTKMPARLTCPRRLSRSARQRTKRLAVRIPINKEFDPASAAGKEMKMRRNRTILI
jgi:hypothetical protein